jgi:hypothetical protein
MSAQQQLRALALSAVRSPILPTEDDAAEFNVPKSRRWCVVRELRHLRVLYQQGARAEAERAALEAADRWHAGWGHKLEDLVDA